MKAFMKNPLRRLGLVAAACVAFDHIDAQATPPVLDSQDSESIVVAQTQSVVVKGHYDNAVGTSDAASQGTISGERLSDLPLLRPGEVLQTMPRHGRFAAFW
jgi:hypothetical protein